MKKVDIVITVYNKEEYITRCLDSVVNQNYPIDEYNIIIIDDGSTDNTKKVIDEYLKKYANIKYYYKDNTGVSDTRNYSLTKLESKYFMFVDADDYISSSLLSELDSYLIEDVDIISFSAFKVNNELTDFEKRIKPVFEKTTGRQAITNYYNIESFSFIDTPWGYLYKTSFFLNEKFNYEYGTEHEDTNMTPIIISKSSTFISTDIMGYYYVQTNNSITRDSSTVIKRLNDKIKHMRELYDYLKDYGFDEETFINISWKIFHGIIQITTRISKSQVDYFINILDKYNIYDIIPSNSKSNRLYKKLFKRFPFISIALFDTMLYEGEYPINDRCWKAFLNFMHCNLYRRYLNMKEKTKSYYLMRIKRAIMFISAYLKYQPALNEKKLYLNYIEMVITTKCTLKCKNCANLISMYKDKAYSIDKETIYSQIKMLLKNVDKIQTFRVLGGEPLLHPDLEKILKKLIKSNKIENIVVVTNGTIVPSSLKLYKIMKNKKVTVSISSYGKLSKNRENLIDKLELYNIKYTVFGIGIDNSKNTWIDYGTPTLKKRNTSSLKKQYLQCSPKCSCELKCPTILNSKFFMCPHAAHLYDLKISKAKKNDYLNINNKLSKKDLINYMKNTEYLNACNYCNMGTNLAHPINMALQI